MLTAFGNFYGALALGLMPVSIPVEDDLGNPGIASQGLEFATERAREMAYSPDPDQRAIAAIWACQHLAAEFDDDA